MSPQSVRSILILGDSGVGKSTFINALKGRQFTESYVSTIGKDLFTYTYGDTTLHLHDMPGQSRWSNICHEYYQYAQGAIIMYDMSDSNETVERWKKELSEYDIPILVVGNKCDTEMYIPNGADIYISCKTGENVDRVIPAIEPLLKPIVLPETWLPDSLWMWIASQTPCCLQ